MKIICSNCKTLLGEQKPFNDPSEVKAKCTSCLIKEKEEALKRLKTQLLPNPEGSREILFENGWKGMLSIAGKETEQLSFWDLFISGKKVFCCKQTREEFKKYLESIPGDEVDVTFVHSAKIKLDKPLGGRRKKKVSEPVEEKKPESIHYNCTIRVDKQYVPSMFEDKAERFNQFVEIFAEIAHKEWLKDREKAAKDGNLSAMSGQREADKAIS